MSASAFHAGISEAIVRGRALAESLMVDVVRVWRSGGEPTVDDLGVVTPAEPILVYEGPAKAQNDRTYPSQQSVADASRVVSMVSHIHFPHGATEIRPDDIVEWIESENPRLVGRKVRISVDQDKTWNTAARFNVSEVVS